MTISHPLPREVEPPCRDDPDRFFPKVGVHPKELKETKAVCREECPFTDACLAYALRYDVAGIWGGTSPGERQEARKRLGIVAESLSMRVAVTNRVSGPGSQSKAEHGSMAAIRAHERAGNKLCELCREERARYQRERREAKRANRPGRADACALRPCPECGREMLPKSLPNHLRTKHREAA